jgi:transcriptional regulator with GAF, ATPase, and Fis domain
LKNFVIQTHTRQADPKKEETHSNISKLPASGMIGEHSSIRKIQDIIHRIAVTDATILITGESGTGKELAARAIHNLSLRPDRPFVPVNCAAIRSFVSDKKSPQPTLGSGQIDLRDATEQLQYRLMEEALRLSNGNKSAAARMLGLKRTTLVAKLRRKPPAGAATELARAQSDQSCPGALAASDSIKDR